jgi:GNAT superfamily N-acetyltransferase
MAPNTLGRLPRKSSTRLASPRSSLSSDIEPGRPDEAMAIARLTRRAWRHAYRGILPDAVLDGMELRGRAARWQQRLEEPSEHSLVWVARGLQGLEGFAWVGSASQHSLHPAPDDAGELIALYVEPALFGGGLGDALMERCEAWLASRFSRSLLWVLEGNLRARRFYTRRGWLADGERMPYAKPGCRGVHIVRHSWGG